MNKLVSPDRPVWFYMFLALGLFATLNTFIGAQGYGSAQVPLLLYLLILAAIIAKYHVVRWRSPSIMLFTIIIAYGAIGSLVARLSGAEASHFTAMALGIIVVSLHFLPPRARIDFTLIKHFLYYSGLLFVTSRTAALIAESYVEIPSGVLVSRAEMAFLVSFVVLIPVFDKNWNRAFLGILLSALFLALDFRTTTFLVYLIILSFIIIFSITPLRRAMRSLYGILALSLPFIVAILMLLFDDLVKKVMEVDRYFRDLLGRADTQTFRENLNDLALEQIANSPWLGEMFQGAGSSLPHYYFGVWRTDPVHNVFLAMGAQGGLVFLVPFIGLLVSLAIGGIRVSTQFWVSQPEGAKVLATLVAALLGAVLSGAVNPFLSYAMGAFWFWTIVMLIYQVRSQLKRFPGLRTEQLRGPPCLSEPNFRYTVRQ